MKTESLKKIDIALNVATILVSLFTIGYIVKGWKKAE